MVFIVKIVTKAEIGHLSVSLSRETRRSAFAYEREVMAGVSGVSGECSQPDLVSLGVFQFPGSKISSNGVSVFAPLEPLGFSTLPNVVALAKIINYALRALHHVGAHSDRKIDLVVFKAETLADLVIPVENSAHEYFVLKPA